MGASMGSNPKVGAAAMATGTPRPAPLTTLPAKATTKEKTPQSHSQAPIPRCESNYSSECVTTRCFTVFATCDHPSKQSIAFLQSFINDLVTRLVLGAWGCRE